MTLVTESTAVNARPILCFQHCTRKAHILCLSLPVACPICDKAVDKNDKLLLQPSVIPSPFSFAVSSPCSVVIKPSKGSFLSCLTTSLDLHAGLTDSRGVVHEYDRRGLTVGSGDWRQCVTIPLFLSKTPESDLPVDSNFWDYTLEVTKNRQWWSRECYDDEEHNCFTFVLDFVRTLQLPTLSHLNRTQFCSQVICPRMKSVARYVTLYRKLEAENVYVKKLTD